MDNRNATALAALRIGAGAVLILAPARAARFWVGPAGDGPGSRVFARLVGGRDLVLGAAALAALRNGEPVAPLLRLGLASDVADAAATVLAARHLTPARRALMPLIAAVGAVAGYVALKTTE